MPTVSNTSTTTTGDFNDVVWTAWNTPTTSSTITGNARIWTSWVETATSSTSTTNIITTDSWTSNSASNTLVWGSWNDNYHAVRQEIRISNEEYRRREAQRLQVEGERREARERAARLLNENLNEQQRLELAEKGHFHLRSLSRDGQERIYRIRKGQVQNIHEVDASGRILNTICAHPRVAVPDEDAMLIQKLMLESPEGHDDFLKIANISRRM